MSKKYRTLFVLRVYSTYNDIYIFESSVVKKEQACKCHYDVLIIPISCPYTVTYTVLLQTRLYCLRFYDA